MAKCKKNLSVNLLQKKSSKEQNLNLFAQSNGASLEEPVYIEGDIEGSETHT